MVVLAGSQVRVPEDNHGSSEKPQQIEIVVATMVELFDGYRALQS